jgi:hypothetical protein
MYEKKKSMHFSNKFQTIIIISYNLFEITLELVTICYSLKWKLLVPLAKWAFSLLYFHRVFLSGKLCWCRFQVICAWNSNDFLNLFRVINSRKRTFKNLICPMNPLNCFRVLCDNDKFLKNILKFLIKEFHGENLNEFNINRF